MESEKVLDIRNYILEKANDAFKMTTFTDSQKKKMIYEAKTMFLSDDRDIARVKYDIKDYFYTMAGFPLRSKDIVNGRYDLIYYDREASKYATSAMMESTGVRDEDGYPIPDRVNVCFDGVYFTPGYSKIGRAHV